MGYQEDRASGRSLAAEVAPLLNGEWRDRSNPDYAGGSITRDDGAELFLRIEGGRLTISGQYPVGWYQKGGRTEHFNIGVSPGRGAAVIAREIERRLLPDYLPEFARVVQAIAEHDRQEAARDDVAGRLAKVVNTSARDGEFTLYRLPGNVYGNIRVGYGGDRVRVEISGLTPDQAEAVLRIASEVAE